MKSQDPQTSQPSHAATPMNGTANGPHPAYAPAPPPLPPALSSPPSLETIAHIVRRRWLTILCLGVLAAGLGFAAVWSLFPGKYTATRNLRISKANRGAYESEESFSSYVRAQTATIKSPDVIRKVLDQTSIQELNEIQSQNDARQWLQDKLVTDTLQSPEILRISLTGDNAEDLAAILDEMIRQYLLEYNTREKIRAVERGAQLTDTYRKTAEALNENRIKLSNKLKDLGIDDPASTALRQSSLQHQIMANQSQIVQLRIQEIGDKEQIRALKATAENPKLITVSAYAVDEKVKDDLTYKFLYEEILTLNKKLADLKSRGIADINSAVPKAVEERANAVTNLTTYAQSRRTEVEEKLRQKTLDDNKEVLSKLEAKLSTYPLQQKILNDETVKLQTEISNLRTANQAGERSTTGVAPLMDEVTQQEMVLKRLGDELGSIQIDNATGSRVELLDKKVAPTARKTDTQTKYAGVTGLVLFGLVFVGVVFWEYGYRRVYTAADVTRGLNLPLLGTLPLLSGSARRGIPAANPAENTADQNAMIEAIDAIRTSLLHAAKTEQIHVVMVTSPGVGEGKTTLACHLAASLARGARNTLLIDCDLRNPAANRQFDLPNEPGFSEALRGEVEYDEAILSTPVARLSLLPAGKADRLAIQCLAQENVEKVFGILREQYEFIVIDVPPVLPVADSLLIGQHADAVVFSVLRNVSRMPALHAAQQKLSSLGIRMLGAVVIGEKADVYDYPQTLRA